MSLQSLTYHNIYKVVKIYSATLHICQAGPPRFFAAVAGGVTAAETCVGAEA
jgi:hypothetical protein